MDIFSAIGKLGIGGEVGFIIGVALVSWVGPETNGGTAILIIIPVVFGSTVSAIVTALLGLRKNNVDKQTGR